MSGCFLYLQRFPSNTDDLDRAHLLMKRHRRNAHGLKHPGSALVVCWEENPQKVAEVSGKWDPLYPGKCRLVKYCDLARILDDGWKTSRPTN